jgi:sugar/nucleoside kinase (ribokinase family)
VLVCALGDLMLDVVVRTGSELAAGGDVPAETSIVPGGQAANVAAWAAALGADARFLGKRGSDLASRLATDELEARGVEIAGPLGAGRGGVVVSFVGPGGERTMASDRGVSADLRAGEIDDAWLTCDHLHLSGYSLAAGPQRAAVERAVERARAHGARVSVDLAAATLIEAVGRSEFRTVLGRLEPDVVFCNEEEERALGSRPDGPTWVVKLGGRGARVGDEIHPAAPVDRVVDATGAGDAFAAGWILGGIALALETAARCVGQVGAMPPPALTPPGCG